VAQDEELRRVIPVIEGWRSRQEADLNRYHEADVARRALEAERAL